MKNPHSENLIEAIAYLKSALTKRIAAYTAGNESGGIKVKGFKLQESTDFFTETIATNRANIFEFITLLLAITPHLQADFFDNLIKDFFPEGSNFPAFGGVRGKNHRGLLPTGETAQFVLAGNDLAKRLVVQQLFTQDHWLSRKQILRLEEVPAGEPLMSGRLLLDGEWLERVTTGRVSMPRLGVGFPARHLQTALEWEDLVLPTSTLQRINEIKMWVLHHQTLLNDWGMRRLLKPGYRALFHGPPGTGKTLTSNLLGKYTGREVFRVDLSTVVSKYIGETEKNLSQLFDKAENKNWILFFDEADALFGKRTQVKNAHDRYANQEVSYLLQRVEEFPGLIILASNFKENMDDAFLRRFNAIIHFPFPNQEERLLLWTKAFPKNIRFSKKNDLREIASRYELAGGSIVNVVQYACLKAIERKSKKINWEDVQQGIRREIEKEGRLFKPLG